MPILLDPLPGKKGAHGENPLGLVWKVVVTAVYKGGYPAFQGSSGLKKNFLYFFDSASETIS